MDKKSKQVNSGINVLKFVAVALVIVIHESFPAAAGLVIKGMAAMAVPVFFMISGYYSYGVSMDKLKKRSLKILYLTVLANLIYFIWDIIVEFLMGNSVGEWLAANCTLKKVAVFFLTNESPLRGHLWFLGALLYSYLFLILFLKLTEKCRGALGEYLRTNRLKIILVISILLMLANLAGGEFLTLYGKNIQVPYIRNWLFMGVPFFCAAYCIHAYEDSGRGQHGKPKLWALLAVSLALNAIEVYFMPQSGLYITTIPVNVTAFMLALRYSEVGSPLLVFLGRMADKYGLWIYILQIIVIKNLRYFYGRYGVDDSLALQCLSPFLVLLLSFALSVIPVWIFHKD